MSLLQREPAAPEEVRIMTMSIQNGLQVGRIFRVVGISKEAPIPEWVRAMSMIHVGPVPPTMHEVDCRGDAELARAMSDIAKPPPPDLTREDVRTLLGCDDTAVTIAVHHLSFPKPTTVHFNDTPNVLGPATRSWESFNARAVKEWVERFELVFPGLLGAKRR